MVPLTQQNIVKNTMSCMQKESSIKTQKKNLFFILHVNINSTKKKLIPNILYMLNFCKHVLGAAHHKAYIWLINILTTPH